MNNDLLVNYLLMKKRTLVEYSKLFYKIYDFSDQNLWNNDQEFESLITSILDIYINKYFLRNESDLEKINTAKLAENDFKMTLALAVVVDYFGNNYEEYKEKYKKSIYNLSLIVYIVTNIDKNVSFYNKKGVTIKSIVECIKELFETALKNTVINDKPFIFETIADKIRDFERMELRFFESLKDSESYLTFSKYDSSNYLVNYIYDIKSLSNYEESDVNKTKNKFDVDSMFFLITLDLSLINILKLYSNKREVPTFYIKVRSDILKDKKKITDVISKFNNVAIKDKIVFMIDLMDYKENYADFNVLVSNKYKICLFHDMKAEKYNISHYKYDIPLYIANYNDNIENINKKITLLSEVTEVTEDKLFDLCVREEI